MFNMYRMTSNLPIVMVHVGIVFFNQVKLVLRQSTSIGILCDISVGSCLLKRVLSSGRLLLLRILLILFLTVYVKFTTRLSGGFSQFLLDLLPGFFLLLPFPHTLVSINMLFCYCYLPHAPEIVRRLPWVLHTLNMAVVICNQPCQRDYTP